MVTTYTTDFRPPPPPGEPSLPGRGTTAPIAPTPTTPASSRGKMIRTNHHVSSIHRRRSARDFVHRAYAATAALVTVHTATFWTYGPARTRELGPRGAR